MRILTVAPHYWPFMGGASLYVKEMSERFVRDGHRASVYTTSASSMEGLFRPDPKRMEPSAENLNGVWIARHRVRHAPPGGFTRRVLGRIPLTAARLLFESPSVIVPGMWRDLLLRVRDFDVVHAMASPLYSLIYPAFVASRLWRKAFVVTPFVHTGEPRGDWQIPLHLEPRRVALLASSDLVIVQSAEERDALVGKGVPGARVRVLGMGVNPDDVEGGDPARFRMRLGIPGSARLIAFVGMLTYDKGAFHALNALGRLRRAGADVRLVMAGQPSPEFEKYYAQQDAGVRAGCILPGSVKGEVKRDLFAACEALVLPSRCDSYGIVFLEAWLAGKPVIGCHAGGIPSVIDDGIDGFLVPFGDDQMLSEYIRMLLADPALAAGMARQGRRKVLEGCTWDLRYRALKDWLEDLTAGSRARRGVRSECPS